MIFKLFLLLCFAATFVPAYCEEKISNDEERARLPELLTELELAHEEASVEDVEALKKIVKRLAPEKNEITGQPGVDYPALTTIPATSFSCRGQKGGYYGDLETNCQVFHICDNGRKISFLCPNGTIFQQSQLICDWWFKVDCSKSAELYEQSAEYFAEEERKRIDNKKMNSEYHRNNNDDNFYQNYDGRQNGRSNPYSQSPNQLPNSQNGKSSSYDPYDRQSTRSQSTHSTSQYTQETAVTRAKNDYSKQNNRQQNQLLANDGKNLGNYERGSNKFYNNQVKSNQEDEYYGSAANVNAQREDKQNFKSTKPRTFTRQSFNNPIQKVTPTYTETTTFRTSTVSPIREFQHLAESAAFASSRGNRYKSNQFNYYSNNKGSTATTPDAIQQSTATTTVSSQKDRTNPQNLVRSRVGIPSFPGPTFTPIYKPRTTALPPREAPTTTQRAYTNTDIFRQGTQDQSTTYGNFETTTYFPEYTTTESQTTFTTSNYKNTNDAQTTFTTDRYTTNIPTTQRPYYTRDFYRETTTIPPFTTTAYDSRETTTHYTEPFTGAFTTIRPIYSGAYSQNTLASNTVNDGTTTPTVSFVDDIQAQDSARFGSPNFSTKNSERTQNNQQNQINPSTEKPSRINQTFTAATPRRTQTPYDTSITYQHGKVMSTLGPYLPFTRSYAFTASTTPRSYNTQTNINHNQISKNQINYKSQNYVSSNYGKSGNRATYLPEKTTPPTFVNEKSVLDSRPPNERKHALDMIKSLQGLEGTVPNLSLNNVNNTRNGLDIPTSSGPSTLHSLALYFANADDIFDTEQPTDPAIQYYETTVNPIEKQNTSVIELPATILTQHTISSYAELFNLNNALENNITGDTSYDISDENLTDEDTSDLDIQQSEGPLSGVKKSNNTKLRELAQVFTQALSAYLQDPDTFKKVLTEIRPTEPPRISDNEITSPTTTEDYPSVTKEKDEVLDFSDDINGIRRRRPTTTPLPETTKDSIETLRDTTYQPYYTPEYFSTTTVYPDESLNEAQSGYIHQPEDQANDVFDSKKLNDVPNYKTTSSSSSTEKDYSNYFPSNLNKYSSRNNNTYSPYGKHVKPTDATPISDNYIASSTPATYEIASPQNFVPAKQNNYANDKLREELSPPAYSNYRSANSIPGSTTNNKSNSGPSGSNVTPVYKRPQETTTRTATTTREPFRIRYYDTTTVRSPKPESLVTASSIHPSYNKNYNNLNNNYRQTERSKMNQKQTTQPASHWTASPSVTQLWETSVFIDPDHINRGLDTDPKITQSSSKIDYRSTTTSENNDFQNNEAHNSVTPQSFSSDPSTPWQWARNNDDSPTAFTLLPNPYAVTENAATPTPTYTTRSSITTTITSSITATNAIPPIDFSIPTRISVYNVTENEVQKAHEMFGNLNETSSNTLMRVMKQADNNATVRQLVLLLISHCNGPMNKTMEEEKEQLLNALLRMPVNEFTSEESRELIKGISKLHLPIGRSASETWNPVTPTTTPSTPTTTTILAAPSEPSVTTFRSRSGRKYKTTTAKPNAKLVEKSDRLAPLQSRSITQDEVTPADNRALDLLRSLYTIAAKWG